jgi:NADP-dependent 3-hydroxy acid dehydrogenase YdfG
LEPHLDVNIKGVLYGIAAALPHMKEQKAVTSSTCRQWPATRSHPREPCTRR